MTAAILAVGAPTMSTVATAPPAASRRTSGGVSQWKRQVTVFAMLMILLVVGVAGASGALMWRMLRLRAGLTARAAATATLP